MFLFALLSFTVKALETNARELTFPYVIKYKQGKENIVADALSRRYVLFSTLDSKFMGFEHVKELYVLSHYFKEIYEACMHGTHDKFYLHDDFNCRHGVFWFRS